ncbi:MAG TPA: hypothetical protein P5307_26275 [Pirellulaceae bacterium]|nr:hypothetical protein [Pirellulaceae bacterium]
MAISRLLLIGLFLFSFWDVNSKVTAQQINQIPKEQITSVGSIQEVQNGVFQIESIGGDQWFVAVERNAIEVVLRGAATAEWLRPGMPVRFQSSFFKNRSGEPSGKAQEPVTELTVFTPREDSKVEIKEVIKRGSKTDRTSKTGTFTVVGVLASYKGNHMTVAVGPTEFEAQLAGDAKISVDLTDLRFASEGDEIQFEGWRYVNQEDKIHATKVLITLAKPLGEVSDKQVASAAEGPEAEASDELLAVARRIQTSLSRAKRGYESGDYSDASGIVVSIIEQWADLVQSDKATAFRLLRPHYTQLKQVHAYLEMEGCMLPPLPESPELNEVASQ